MSGSYGVGAVGKPHVLIFIHERLPLHATAIVGALRAVGTIFRMSPTDSRSARPSLTRARRPNLRTRRQLSHCDSHPPQRRGPVHPGSGRSRTRRVAAKADTYRA